MALVRLNPTTMSYLLGLDKDLMLLAVSVRA